ncbi:zinc finger, CCHC-type containing protein [Tanacetum coccineum]
MTAPYTPQQNGISKKKNRVLKEKVNSMLSYSGLSQWFLDEAMLTACYLLNKVPNKRNMITPYELWTKRKPNLNYLRVWGYRAVVRLNDNIGSGFMSTSKRNDSILWLWHARLGHAYFKRMQDMSKDGLILTFEMDTEKCKTCMLTKITKKLFQNVKHKTEILELIHSDLCDLHATPSLGNNKYFVIFIDDASRFCYVYLLHTKDEALDKFKVFKTEVELQQESQIKRFRTDRGDEYMDALYFQSVGIIYDMTAPYTPQQNGIS